MFDDVRACQAVGDFLARLLAREFPGVQAAFVCVSAEESPPKDTIQAAAVMETLAPETSPPAPPE